MTSQKIRRKITMKTRLKKIMALLGMSAMLVCQNGIFVLADSNENESVAEMVVEEDVDSDEIQNTTETDEQEDSTETDETTENDESDPEISVYELENDESKSEDETISSDLVAATDLKWSDEVKGQAVFTFNTTSALKYSLTFYKNGEKIDTMSGTKAVSEGSVTRTWNSNVEINDDGAVYTFQIKTYDIDTEKLDFDLTTGICSETSPEYTYEKPSDKIDVPNNIKWDSTGKVTWDAVDNAWRYYAILLRSKEGEDNLSYCGRSSYTTSTEWNFADDLAEGYNYYVRVCAFSNNIEEYANGDWSEDIPFNQSDIAVGETNNKLDTAINSADGDATAQVEAVKTAFADTTAKEELQIAMQTDESTQEKIKSLEESYKTAMGLETETKVDSLDADLGIDTDSVSILGAALNATKAGKVTFNLSKPDEDTQKSLIESNTQFTKAIVLDLSLDGAGIEAGKDLAIPVTVTMPAPTGIDIDKLTVLHYNADNTKYETLTVRKNSDGKISFTVTHFSNFVFGEKTVSSNVVNNGESASVSDESNYVSSDDEESSSSSSVVVTTVKQPTIGTSKGWSAISGEVDKAIAKLTAGDTTPAVVSVNLNGVETIPATAISAISGKNVVLSIIADESTLITIDGSQLTTLDASDVKLISKKDTDGKTMLNVRTQNLNLEKNMVVYSNVGIDKMGSIVTLYFENADKSLLEFRTSPVFDNGYAAFITPFVNANYKISIQ
jgi:hypothetical protein